MTDKMMFDRFPERRPGWDRREFIKTAAAGTAIVAVGGALFTLAGDDLTRKARAEKRPDGRPRLPPGQRVITYMKDMGGDEGPSDARAFRLQIHGAVKTPYTLDYKQLLELPQVEQEADVHCVTGWSLLGSLFKGVTVATLADRAGVKSAVRHVIFEAAHGFTSNVPLAEATAPSVLATYRVGGKPFSTAHGAPVRALVPDLYFWKSAKWLTGIKFVVDDEPGYWEVRGYHNHADPWREERYG
ncbi:MAG TPA: molybdopterin-dependent oxidoreductase [Kofleriaceae bacterium]|nr:molybdopterin-dependent oxidoreductase [Kofleriaceae bacterium]